MTWTSVKGLRQERREPAARGILVDVTFGFTLTSNGIELVSGTVVPSLSPPNHIISWEAE